MIFVSGSIAYDYIMTYDGNFANHILPDKLPQLSMWFGVAKMDKYNWGAGHNIAYAIGQLGWKDQVVLWGSVGKDFVKEYDNNINYDYLTNIDYLNTATGFIFTDMDNNQITPFYPGAMALIHTKAMDILDQKEFSHAIISPNDTQAMIPHLQATKSKGIVTIFDPGQAVHFLTDEQLTQASTIADMLIVNDYEWSLWQEKTGHTENSTDSSIHTVIVTKWEQGVSYRTKESNAWNTIEAIPCENVIDPTWAGDALRWGLLFGLSQGRSLSESLQMGQEVAWHCIQSAGGQNYKL